MADLLLFEGRNLVKFSGWESVTQAKTLGDMITNAGGVFQAINYGGMGWINVAGGIGTNFDIPQDKIIEIWMSNLVTVWVPWAFVETGEGGIAPDVPTPPGDIYLPPPDIPTTEIGIPPNEGGGEQIKSGLPLLGLLALGLLAIIMLVKK